MAERVTFQIKGLPLISQRLRNLPDVIRKQVAMGGVRAGAEEIAKVAEVNTKALDDPRTPNVIAKNVAVRFSPIRFRRTGDVMYRVGLLGGAATIPSGAEPGDADDRGGNPGGATFYWRFLEFGTSRIAARSPMRKAMNSTRQAAFDTAATEMSRRLAKINPDNTV